MLHDSKLVSDDIGVEGNGNRKRITSEDGVFKDGDASGDLNFFLKQFVREFHPTGGQKSHPVSNRNPVVDVGVHKGKDQFHHPFRRALTGHFPEQRCEFVARDDTVLVGVKLFGELDGRHGRIG